MCVFCNFFPVTFFLSTSQLTPMLISDIPVDVNPTNHFTGGKPTNQPLVSL